MSASLGLDTSAPSHPSAAISSASRKIDLCTAPQRGFDVTRLENDPAPFDEIGSPFSTISAARTFRNTGVHSNQCKRGKILKRRVKRSASY
ncbi:Hypothetical predicted protein [Scomber scombrus]|uniref:Uncharacterized protein n=1 Tax=Scomber scombrus TaxID=13677 RepID=A0AAV1PDV3_SCOSC